MKRITLLLLIIWALTSHATNLDSLMKIWNNNSLHDTIRLEAIDNIVQFYMDSKPDSAFMLVKKEIELAIMKRNIKWQANALFNQGRIFQNKENYIEAINSYSKSLKLSKEFGFQKLMAKNFNELGGIYYKHGIYVKALENFIDYLRLCEKFKDKNEEAKAYANLGRIYFAMKEYSKSLEYSIKSLSLTESSDKFHLAKLYNNIANIHSELGDHQKAIEFYNNSKKLFEELGDKDGLANYYSNVGYLYVNKGDYKNARVNLNESLKIYEGLNSEGGIALVSGNIGYLLLKQRNFKQAIIWCEKALQISRKKGILKWEEDACDCLYKANKGLGNGSKALEYYELSMKLDDSLKKEETTKKLQQMEFQKKLLADSLQQEQEKVRIEMAHKEQMNKQRIQKLLLLFGGIVFVIITTGTWWRLRFTRKAKAVIEKEKNRSENLLLNILPPEVAEELKATGKAEARDFDQVSILFSDFKGFTQVSEQLSAKELVSEINYCFEAFDGIVEKYGVEKIKTIGDAYMAAGNLPVSIPDSVRNTVKAALEMQDFIKKRKTEREDQNQPAFEMRLGIHTGPVVAGIVGVKKFQYDIWGDTVNTASRMESSGEAGKVNISQPTYGFIKDDPEFAFEYRGKVAAKNKGEIDMYFVTSKS